MKLNVSQEIEIRNIIQSQLELMDLNGRNKHRLIDSISWSIKEKLAKEFSDLEEIINKEKLNN